jgi:hypothetical protein
MPMMHGWRQALPTTLGIVLAATAAAQDPGPAKPMVDAAKTRLERLFTWLRATATGPCVFTVERVEVRIPDLREEHVAPLAATLLELSGSPGVSADSPRLMETVARLREVCAAMPRPAAPEGGGPPPVPFTAVQHTMIVAQADGIWVENDVDRTLRSFPAVATGKDEQLMWDRDNNQVDYFVGREAVATSLGLASLLRPLPVEPLMQQAAANLAWSAATRGEDGARKTMLTGTRPDYRLDVELDGADRPVRATLATGAEPPRLAGFYSHAPPGGDGHRPLLSRSVVVNWQKTRLIVESCRLLDVSFAAPTEQQLTIAVPADAKIFVFRKDPPTSMLPIDRPELWPEFVKRHLRVH